MNFRYISSFLLCAALLMVPASFGAASRLSDNTLRLMGCCDGNYAGIDSFELNQNLFLSSISSGLDDIYPLSAKQIKSLQSNPNYIVHVSKAAFEEKYLQARPGATNVEELWPAQLDNVRNLLFCVYEASMPKPGETVVEQPWIEQYVRLTAGIPRPQLAQLIKVKEADIPKLLGERAGLLKKKSAAVVPVVSNNELAAIVAMSKSARSQSSLALPAYLVEHWKKNKSSEWHSLKRAFGAELFKENDFCICIKRQDFIDGYCGKQTSLRELSSAEQEFDRLSALAHESIRTLASKQLPATGDGGEPHAGGSVKVVVDRVARSHNQANKLLDPRDNIVIPRELIRHWQDTRSARGIEILRLFDADSSAGDALIVQTREDFVAQELKCSVPEMRLRSGAELVAAHAKFDSIFRDVNDGLTAIFERPPRKPVSVVPAGVGSFEGDFLSRLTLREQKELLAQVSQSEQKKAAFAPIESRVSRAPRFVDTAFQANKALLEGFGHNYEEIHEFSVNNALLVDSVYDGTDLMYGLSQNQRDHLKADPKNLVKISGPVFKKRWIKNHPAVRACRDHEYKRVCKVVEPDAEHQWHELLESVRLIMVAREGTRRKEAAFIPEEVYHAQELARMPKHKAAQLLGMSEEKVSEMFAGFNSPSPVASACSATANQDQSAEPDNFIAISSSLAWYWMKSNNERGIAILRALGDPTDNETFASSVTKTAMICQSRENFVKRQCNFGPIDKSKNIKNQQDKRRKLRKKANSEFDELVRQVREEGALFNRMNVVDQSPTEDGGPSNPVAAQEYERFQLSQDIADNFNAPLTAREDAETAAQKKKKRVNAFKADLVNSAVVAHDPNITPLMHAVQKNDPALVKTLLAQGADIDAVDSKGNKARDYAQEPTHKSVWMLLQARAKELKKSRMQAPPQEQEQSPELQPVPTSSDSERLAQLRAKLAGAFSPQDMTEDEYTELLKKFHNLKKAEQQRLRPLVPHQLRHWLPAQRVVPSAVVPHVSQTKKRPTAEEHHRSKMSSAAKPSGKNKKSNQSLLYAAPGLPMNTAASQPLFPPMAREHRAQDAVMSAMVDAAVVRAVLPVYQAPVAVENKQEEPAVLGHERARLPKIQLGNQFNPSELDLEKLLHGIGAKGRHVLTPDEKDQCVVRKQSANGCFTISLEEGLGRELFGDDLTLKTKTFYPQGYDWKKIEKSIVDAHANMVPNSLKQQADGRYVALGVTENPDVDVRYNKMYIKFVYSQDGEHLLTAHPVI